MTQRELGDFRAPAESLIEIARGEIDALYALVRDMGYVVLLCDPNGVAIDHRGDDALADQFKYWGIWLGGVWSEALEGTNGIGTCVNALRPVTVHLGQHFRARHVPLSCSGAPIFDAECKLAAVLDVSSLDPGVSEHAHALTLPVTARAARAIELRLFRQHFNRRWVIALSRGEGGHDSITMAIDADQRLLGADRTARQALMIDDRSLRDGDSLWTHFERNPALLRGNSGEDIPALLRRRTDGGEWRAIVTPPAAGAGGSASSAAFHIQPRLAKLADMRAPAGVGTLRGGLAPAALRRVQDYVDARLHETISVEDLAAVAGLSMWHFAHAFKRSTGVTPHHYVLQQRVERARELLNGTDRPLSEIALSVGFSDHSHFARHYRRQFGTSPGAARRNRPQPH